MEYTRVFMNVIGDTGWASQGGSQDNPDNGIQFKRQLKNKINGFPVLLVD